MGRHRRSERLADPRWLLAQIVVASVGIFVLGRDTPPTFDPPAPTVSTGPLELDAPATVAAGQPFTVTVRGSTVGETIIAMIDGGYGTRRVVVPSEGPETEIEIDAAATAASGVVLVTAMTGTGVATASLEITPGAAVDPVELYLGPRSIVTGPGQPSPEDPGSLRPQYTMIVAVAVDRWGNPLPDGTTVNWTIIRADESIERMQSTVDGLLTSIIVFASDVAGRSRVVASVGEAGSSERTFLELASQPEPFTLELVDETPIADGQTLVRIRSSRLVDALGNEFPDGLAVFLDTTFVADGSAEERRGRLRGTTIDSVVEFVIEAPDRAGTGTYVALVSGVASASLDVEFEAAVRELPATAEVTDFGWLVSVGPVYTTRGGYVPEATVARITVGERDFELPLEEGLGELLIPAPEGPEADVNEVSIEVLGLSRMIKVANP